MTKEEKREYNKQYRILHKEEIAERMNKYAKEHRKEWNERNRNYRKNNKEKHNEQNKKEYKDMKLKVYALYGGKCELCNSLDNLQIHHKNIDGVEERNNGFSNGNLFRSLITNGKREDLQLLCSSCHHKVHYNIKHNLEWELEE